VGQQIGKFTVTVDGKVVAEGENRIVTGRPYPNGIVPKFIILDASRSPVFEEFKLKYLGFHTMFGFNPQNTDAPNLRRGEVENQVSGLPDDVIKVYIEGSLQSAYTIPPGKKATKIRYTYEIILDDLPQCSDCRGSGQIVLFSTVEGCKSCGGSGYRST